MSPQEYLLCPDCPESQPVSEADVDYNNNNKPVCPNCGSTLLTRIND